MRDLEGKTAVVTGSASGMGRAFAECFGRRGHERRDGRHRGAGAARRGPPRWSRWARACSRS